MNIHELGFSLHHLGWNDPTVITLAAAAIALVIAAVTWEPTKN